MQISDKGLQMLFDVVTKSWYAL